MEFFFFFVLVFNSLGRLQEVTASPNYDTLAQCQEERERMYYKVPVADSGTRRIVTHCASVVATALPRCQ